MFYKWLVLLLILSHILFAQKAKRPEIYHENELWGLGSPQPITAPVYDTLIFIASADLLIAKKHKAGFRVNTTGVISYKGKMIVPFDYLQITSYADNLIVSKWQNGETYFGVLSSSNEVILPCRFRKITRINNNWVAITQTGKLKLYDNTGNPISTIDADSLSASNNLNYLFTFKNGKVGLASSSGQTIVPNEYKSLQNENGYWEATPFPTWTLATRNDTTSLQADSLSVWEPNVNILGYRNTYYIVKQGKHVGNAYNSIEAKTKELAIVREDNMFGVVSNNGNVVVPIAFNKTVIQLGYIHAMKNNLWDLYDSLGTKTSVFSYDSIGNISEGLFPVKRKGKWGFMNRRGVEVIHCIYDSLTPFINSKSIINYFGKKGIIDHSGSWIVKPIYAEITGFGYDFFTAKSDKQYVLKTYNNELIYFTTHLLFTGGGKIYEQDSKGYRIEMSRMGVTGKTDSLGMLESKQDWRIIVINNKFGFEDKNGLLKITYRYDSLLPYSEGLAAFKIRGRWGFINRDEQIVVQPHYSNVAPFRNGLSVVGLDNKLGLINNWGKLILEPKYECMEALGYNLWLVSAQNLYGLFNSSGRVILHPLFDEINYINKDLIIVRKKNKYGVVTIKGNNVVPRVYDYIGYNKPQQTLLLKKNPEKPVRFNLK